METKVIAVEKESGGRWLALSALVLSALVVALDTTVLVTALPTLSAELGASTSELQWISDAYTLALGGLLLPAGLLGDRYGRRRLLLIGLLLFGLASLVASRATTATELIAMRGVMGAGSAVLIPLSISILPTMFSEQERPRAVAVATAGAFLGLPLGPLVAGWLLTHSTWGTIFLINAPVVAVAMLAVTLWVPESADPKAPRLDWLGALLAVVGVTALVYGIIEEPARGWSDARVLAGVAGGAVALAAFTAIELRSRAPMVDLRLFRNPTFTWSTIAFVLVGFGMLGVLFVLSPYLQIVQGNDAQGTGVRMLPMIAAVIAGALGGDRVVPRLGTRAVVSAGLLVMSAGLVLLSRVGADTGYGLVAASIVVMGVGMGLAMPTAMDAILGALPAAQVGVGTALTRTLQQVSMSLGVAVLGSILISSYQGGLAGHLSGLPAQAQEVARGSIAGAAAVAAHLPRPLGAPLLRAAFSAYAQGTAQVMLVSAAVVLVAALLAALFLPNRRPAHE